MLHIISTLFEIINNKLLAYCLGNKIKGELFVGF